MSPDPIFKEEPGERVLTCRLFVELTERDPQAIVPEGHSQGIYSRGLKFDDPKVILKFMYC